MDIIDTHQGDNLIIYNRTNSIIKWTKEGPILGDKYNVNELIKEGDKEELLDYLEDLTFECDFYQRFQLEELKDYLMSCCVHFKAL